MSIMISGNIQTPMIARKGQDHPSTAPPERHKLLNLFIQFNSKWLCYCWLLYGHLKNVKTNSLSIRTLRAVLQRYLSAFILHTFCDFCPKKVIKGQFDDSESLEIWVLMVLIPPAPSALCAEWA